MQKLRSFIQANYKMIAVILFASLAGGLISTVLVANAAIPASDGAIYGCRNNTTTMLRVIDNSSQSCDSNESTLNWDQKGVKAYAFVGYSSGTHTLDTNRSYNITDFQYSLPAFATRQFCFTINGTPKNISAMTSAISGGRNIVAAGIKDSSGWTSADNTCDTQSPGSNVFVKVQDYGTSFFVTVY